jgi:hypothetical protein
MKIVFKIVFFLLFPFLVNAQTGIGTITPDASAKLEVSSTSKGILFPRMTTVQRNAIISPAYGLHVFDTDVNALWFYDGAVWINYATQAKFGDIKSGIQTADHDGWFILNGRLKTDLNLRQQGRATALSIGTNVPNASNSYLSQNGGTMGAVSAGNNTVTLEQANLPNITIGGTANAAGSHEHIVDPPNTATTTTGQHNHSFPRGFSGLSFAWSVGDGVAGFTLNGSINTGDAGNHNHSVDIAGFWSASAGNHSHTITTSSINGGVTQTAINIAPKTLTVNMFIYLGL